MKEEVLENLSYYFEAIWRAIKDALVPEDKVIEKLLKSSPSDMRMLLPKTSAIPLPHTYSLFSYKNASVRACVLAIKYKRHKEMISRMAAYLYEDMFDLLSDIMLFEGERKIILIPMPASKRRMKKYGFNQCEDLCREISKLGDFFKLETDTLLKSRETESQTKFAKSERLKNVEGSMVVRGTEKIKDQTVVVVDDVYTTGATTKEARRALKGAGARRAISFTLGH